jgi:hypothetical protein
MPGGPVQGLAQIRGPSPRAPRRPRPRTGRRWPARSRSQCPGGGCPAGPGTRPARRPPASSRSGHGSRPGCRTPAMLRQQARHEGRQLERDIEHDTIRQHTETPGRYGSCGETFCTGGSALSRGSPAMSACLPICGATPGSLLLRKTSVCSVEPCGSDDAVAVS